MKPAAKKKTTPPPSRKKTPAKRRSKSPVLDGKTGGVIRTDVDGRQATIKVTKPKRVQEPPKGITRLAPPRLNGTDAAKAMVSLQTAIDQKIVFGIKQPLTTLSSCEYEWYDAKSNQSVGCAGAAAFDIEHIDTCEKCQHTSKKPELKLCVSHMAMKMLDELPDRQTSMFDADEDDALELED